MMTLSNYRSSSAASRHLLPILPGRRNERIKHVGQVEQEPRTEGAEYDGGDWEEEK